MSHSNRSTFFFALAAIFGLVHGLFSLYWSAGGTWLLLTLGEKLASLTSSLWWVLFVAGIIKIGFALLPLWKSASSNHYIRAGLWLGAILLIIWGGLNTLIGNLVLMNIIVPEEGYDRIGMIGHAWLWDPLFLLWGIALILGLRASRRS